MRIVDKAGRRLAPPLVPRLLAAPLACLLYGEATVIMTSIALAIPGDVVQRAASPAALALAVAAVSAALLWRTALPLGTLALESAALVAATATGLDSYAVVPFLVATFAAGRHAPFPRSLAGLALAFAAMAASSLVAAGGAGPAALVAEIAARELTAGSAFLLGGALRGAHDTREARARAMAAEARRDQAERQARMADALHDSVGQRLTAIVTLCEGLGGGTGDERVDAAVAAINAEAREGLAQTRETVRELAGLVADAEEKTGGGPIDAGWDPRGQTPDDDGGGSPG